MKITSDILIIGSGIAGLSLALKTADHFDVVLVTKKEAVEANTRYAQGGIAAALSALDNFDSHIEDTLTAGAGLCNPSVVERIVRDGPRLIEELTQLGVRFTRKKNREYDLGREGGHSQRRVVHAGDITGNELEKSLLLQAKRHPRIRIFEHHIAVDLILSQKLDPQSPENRCLGAYVLDAPNDIVHTFEARITILATGGAGKVYLYTSNPDIATGDGMAMAYRAGAVLANMEFVQFHPTCLYNPGGRALAANRKMTEEKSFLISEAVRGEGAKLKLIDNTSFMNAYHPLKELAPRDIVARAIDFEMKKRGHPYVLLDISHKRKAFILKRFPNIYKLCKQFGFDITKGPIPVVPAAHYFCGGVHIDLEGHSSIPSLLAIGECAHTGLHGANRLASNSLLEALALADYTSNAINRDLPRMSKSELTIPDWNPGEATVSDETVVITQNWEEIRRFMWNYVGIVRSNKRLERAKKRIELLNDEIKEYYWNFKVTRDLIELRNLAQVAEMIVRSAIARKESRGLHTNLDYPESKETERKDTLISTISA